MAGHSKWSNIQYRKNAQDAKRGRLFTKLIREVTVAARQSEDTAINPRLRLAVAKALAANVNRDTLDRAIQRGAKGLEGGNLEEVRYEGYGPGGIAMMVDTLTDNRNRTVADIRHLCHKHGGNLGIEGSVAWNFSKKGLLSLQEALKETELLALALETGAENILMASQNKPSRLITTPEALDRVCSTLETKGIGIDQVSLTWLPITPMTQLEQDLQEPVMRLLEGLEDLDDVQRVYSDWELL